MPVRVRWPLSCSPVLITYHLTRSARSPLPKVHADKWSRPDHTGDVSASEIINELPKLTEAERQAILDKLRELAQVDDDRWEQIINEPMPRPKLKAFIEQATAEGNEPLDLNRM
jgi:hypothetical protein